MPTSSRYVDRKLLFVQRGNSTTLFWRVDFMVFNLLFFAEEAISELTHLRPLFVNGARDCHKTKIPTIIAENVATDSRV